MPALLNYRGDDEYRTRGPLCAMDSNRLFSVPDLYSPPCKRLRVRGSYFLFFEEKKKPSIEILPDECLYEIFRRLPGGGQARSSAACVSNRWLTVLSHVRNSEIVSNEADVDTIQERENYGYLTRCLEGKKATDTRLAAVAVGTAARGGLGKLSVRGTDRVTSRGFAAIARGCPSLKVLSLWDVSSVDDESLIEISRECGSLERLDLCRCPSISNAGIAAIAARCPNLSSLTIESCKNVGNESLRAAARTCWNLQSITVSDCPLIGDQGVATLLSSTFSGLKTVRLQLLNITDFSLAVIGHYGKSITNLALGNLRGVSQKGFWAMGNAKGLLSLTSLNVNSCYGVTDLSLEAIGNGCITLKQMSLKRCCFVSDKGLSSFARAAGSLECLQLEECSRISPHGIFETLSNRDSKLKSLSIVKCMGIKDAAYETAHVSGSESLRSLTIRNCIGFGNSSLAVVGKLCPRLRHLDLTGLCGITDAGLFPLLQACEPGLVKVNLGKCLNLTDGVVVDLAQVHGGTLELLHLDGCRKITDESLAAVAENCPLLNDLDVSGCGITDSGLASLSEGVQVNLQVLSLSGCAKVSNQSVGCLEKLGQTLVGLNLQNCNSISGSTVDSLVGNLWRCDILS